MRGHGRRSSTSSVETVDEGQIRWRQEASVVRRVPEGCGSDEWPVFELQDAIVLNQDGQTVENALEVGIKGPFIVRGQLTIDDAEQKQHLLMRVRSSMPIEIRQSKSYSMGESDGGRPIIWVSGRGGWYELKPCKAYRAFYNKMCEATTLYYNLIDIYSSKRPKKKKKPKGNFPMEELSRVFLQYAARVGDGSTFDEVIQRCLDHASFFIWQFSQEDSTFFDWTATGFHKWLVAQNPTTYEKAQDLMRNPWKLPRFSTQSRSPAPTSPEAFLSSKEKASRRTSVAVTASSADSLMRSESSASKPATGAATVNHDTSATAATKRARARNESDAQDEAFMSVFEALEWAREQLKSSKYGMTASSVTNKLYFAYRFPTYRDGTVGSHRIPVQELLHYNAKALLRNMDKSKYEGHEIYEYLQTLAEADFNPVAIKASHLPFVLLPRRPVMRLPRKSDADPGGRKVSPGSYQAAPNVGRSVITRGGKQLGRRGGKKSSLRLPSRPNKRPISEVESDSEPDGPGTKKSYYFSDEDDDLDYGTDAADAVSSMAAGGMPEKRKAEEPVKVFVHAEKIPSTIQNGLQGAWACDQEDCDHVVRGGDEEECRARIHAHFHEHREQTERVNLAVAESRGLLPINHLLEKIKKMGEMSQQEQQLYVNGAPTPRPIKRNLIV